RVNFDPATQSALDVFPDLSLFDNRYNNVAVQRMDALDLAARVRFVTAAGDFELSSGATYTLRHSRSITETSPAFPLINAAQLPVDFRARGDVHWERDALSANLGVNYVDDYPNVFGPPGNRIGSWTTCDLTVRLAGPLESDFSLTVSNVFDR